MFIRCQGSFTKVGKNLAVERQTFISFLPTLKDWHLFPTLRGRTYQQPFLPKYPSPLFRERNTCIQYLNQSIQKNYTFNSSFIIPHVVVQQLSLIIIIIFSYRGIISYIILQTNITKNIYSYTYAHKQSNIKILAFKLWLIWYPEKFSHHQQY